MVIKGETEGGGTNGECGINKYKLLYIKLLRNKNLLYSTENYIQYLVIIYNGIQSEKTPTESLCYTPEINTIF